MFNGASHKLTIGSLDDTQLAVTAQYNPKDIQIDRSVPWTSNNQIDNRPANQRKPPEHDVEYTGAGGRTLTIELLFDCYELKGRSIEPIVEALDKLACIRKADSGAIEEHRPHRCVVSWGPGTGTQGMRPFRCVIESVSTKYSMFDRNGTPVRAVCTVKLREANVKQ